MQLRVDGSSLSYTSGRLRSVADAARDLAGAMRRTASADLDVDLDAGIRQLAGVGWDALDLVAADLELVVASLLAGGRLYDVVEAAAAGTGANGGPQ